MSNVDQIRAQFLSFFESKGHYVVPSSPLVPQNDPSLLFVNAGMVPFKNIFLGQEERSYKMACSAQRCVRAGGKHNDLANVGMTERHHTYFEMLGNFSFGEYFKEEAISYAWHFLTKVLNIPKEKLYISVHKSDEESKAIWQNTIGIPEEKIAICNDQDNFWSMGDTGPCGPCTEIFYDHGEDLPGGPPGSPDQDGPRFVEIWNLVFMQYNRDGQGICHPLPKPCVDTGMGLDRIAAVLEGTHDNYETETFQKLRLAIMPLIAKEAPEHTWRILADHVRASIIMIADDIYPSAEGRGYVLRRIIRRACRYAYQAQANLPILSQLVAQTIDLLKGGYPELVDRQTQIQNILEKEEKQFAETLAQGMQFLDQSLQKGNTKRLSGEDAFKLYDTYGFPIDLTTDICQERGIDIDMMAFDHAMKAQRERSRAKQKFQSTLYLPDEINKTTFTGYEQSQDCAKILALSSKQGLVEHLREEGEAIVILDQSPCYPEGGGQIGDQGLITTDQGYFIVTDTQKQGEIILHIGHLDSGVLSVGDQVNVKVSDEHPEIRKHHTATHLLHAALRDTLGEHVQQKGSLVTSDRLRFDFTHGTPLSDQTCETIERHVNQAIQKNLPAEFEIMTMEQAQEKGAMALFSEKYSESVRVVTFGDVSCELCGGSHVQATGAIGLFKIVQQSSVASGIRRIEALVGESALAWVQQRLKILQEASLMLKSSELDLTAKIKKLQTEQKQAPKNSTLDGQTYLHQWQQDKVVHAGTAWICPKTSKLQVQEMRMIADAIKTSEEPTVLVITQIGDKGCLCVIASHQTSIDARALMHHLGEALGGGGGGRQDFAQGRLLNIEKLDEVIHNLPHQFKP